MPMSASTTDFARHLSSYFLRHLTYEKGLSATTIASRRTAFVLLVKYCRENEGIPAKKMTVQAIDRDLVMRFLDWLEDDRGNCVATRNVRLDAIKTFFAYLVAVAPEHMHQCQRVLSIPRKKEPKAMVGWLGLDAVKAILEMPDSSTYHGLRDLALLTLLYDSAARVSEIAGARTRDLRLDEPACIRLLGKGNKERSVPLTSAAVDVLREYLLRAKSRGCCKPADHLFVNRSGNGLTRGGISYVLRKYCEEAMRRRPDAGVRAITPHIMRHSKAVHLLQAGVPLIYIRDFLGHADVTTTEVYAKCEASEIRAALEKSGGIDVEVEEPVWQREDGILRWLESLSQ